MFNFEGTPTHRKQKEMTIEGLDEYVSDYCGDVYYTSLNLFPGFKLLREVKLNFQDGFNGITSAILDDGEPGIWVSQNDGFVTDSMKSRPVERFNLSDEYFDALDSAFLPFLFAHELGHIAQAEPSFSNYFGNLDKRLIDNDLDYAGYVNSDLELNADYISAVIIGNSEFGSEIGFFPPEEPPMAWRDWGNAHPVPNTIALHFIQE